MTTSDQDKEAAIYEINNRLFFRFFQAANTLHTKGTQALEEFGVTTQQWSVLGALSRPKAENGMSVNELSRYLLITRQNLT
ncbi:MAG: helix-turn-helix domain-containing protein, partial [Advenella sp.]|nr:helix-turn-helix domain-containing protein [Advenella sp.]